LEQASSSHVGTILLQIHQFPGQNRMILSELQLSGENKLFFFMHIVQQYAADLLVVFGRSV
jgi:hypothetical protein